MPSNICYMMIQAHEQRHSTCNLPYLTLVTRIMAAEKVPFKVTANRQKDGRAVGHGTLKKRGLIQTDATTPSSTSTLRLGPFRARSASVKSTMIGLLHKLVCKVLCVLKNQKTVASSQRKLEADHNDNHPENPIELESISGSDNDAKAEEEAFDVPAPQFQENPHLDDDAAFVGGGGDFEILDDDDGDEDGDHDADDDGDDDMRTTKEMKVEKKEEDDDEDPKYRGD